MAGIQVRIGASFGSKQLRGAKGRFGPKNDPSGNLGAVNFSAGLNKWLQESISPRVVSSTHEQIIKILEAAAGPITQAMMDDLQTFTQKGLRFFFRQQSPAEGGTLFIRLSDISASGFASGRRGNPDATIEQVLWPALKKSTVKRKKLTDHANTFFLDSGALQMALSGPEGLAGAFQDILRPGIQITTQEVPDTTNPKRIIKVAQVTAVAGSYSGGGLSSVSTGFLQGKVFNAAPMDIGLLRTYLKQRLVDNAKLRAVSLTKKLENGPRTNTVLTQRPWIEPMMSYWVLRRMSAVVQNGLKNALSKYLKPSTR